MHMLIYVWQTCRSIETYVKMGDRIAVRQDQAATVPVGRDLPPTILEQAADIVHRWESHAATARLDATAEAMYGAEGTGAAGERTSDASAAARARWAQLSSCEVWRDREFLKTLVDDAESSTGHSRRPSRASVQKSD